MRINEATVVQGPLVRLVPYRREHVQRYHAWMQDPELLELTCSEQLTLEEEMANQASWHADAMKCTFIVCSEPPGTPLDDLTRGMSGDVNAFFTPWDPSSDEPDDSDRAETPLLAELEIMVAEATQRRHGLAKQALALFMHYVVEHVPRTCAFCAKIGDANLPSIALFEKLGFTEHKRMAIFEQVELRLPITMELRASLRQSFVDLGGTMRELPPLAGKDGAVVAPPACEAPTLETPPASCPELLGDKTPIRKTLVRHIVATITSHVPCRAFGDLRILELGSGAGFFARAYEEVYGEPLERLVQTDADPQHTGVETLDVNHLASARVAGQELGSAPFDVVLSVDVLSCFAFGAGLDPDDDDDKDAMAALDGGLSRVLKPGGAYFDFMPSVPNSQFVMRFIADYCRRHPGRFICVLDPSSDDGGGGGGDGGAGSSADDEDDQPLFVTFDARSLLRQSESDAGPLLYVAGHEAPFTHASLCEALQLRTAEGDESRAFAAKVLEYLFRDINQGGCPDNWELLSYVSVDVAHFAEVFEDDGEKRIPVFLETFRRALLFLRDAFRARGAESYQEITLVDAFTSTVATQLKGHAVERVESDVAGSNGDCYSQRYSNARFLVDRDPNGEGAFRCLLTKVSVAAT